MYLFYPKRSAVILFVLLTASLSAQLRKGDNFIGFGPQLPFSSDDGLIPVLPTDLMQLGYEPGQNAFTAYALPSYGRMVTDFLQVYAAASLLSPGYADQFEASISLGVRGYPINRVRTALFVGANFLLDGSGKYAVPVLGLNYGLTDHLRLVPELAYRTAVGGDASGGDAVVLQLGIEYLLNSRTQHDGLSLDFTSGSVLLGISALSWTKQTGEEHHAFQCSPSVQLLLGPKTAVGVQGQYISGNLQSGTSVFQIGIGPVLRQFFGVAGGPAAPFLEAGVTHHSQRLTTPNTIRRTQTYQSGHVAAGLLILLHPGIGLETSLSYQRLLGNNRLRGTGNFVALNLGGRFILPG